MLDTGTYSLVLIVEPDETTLSAMIKALRRAGYHASGTTTFERAREQILSDPPRVLLTGAQLGAFSGLHLAVLARHRRPDCHAVILAPAPEPVLEQEAASVGAIVMAKPALASALPALIDSILLRSSTSQTIQFVVGPETDRRRGERRQLVITPFTPERRVAERRRM